MSNLAQKERPELTPGQQLLQLDKQFYDKIYSINTNLKNAREASELGKRSFNEAAVDTFNTAFNLLNGVAASKSLPQSASKSAWLNTAWEDLIHASSKLVDNGIAPLEHLKNTIKAAESHNVSQDTIKAALGWRAFSNYLNVDSTADKSLDAFFRDLKKKSPEYGAAIGEIEGLLGIYPTLNTNNLSDAIDSVNNAALSDEVKGAITNKLKKVAGANGGAWSGFIETSSGIKGASSVDEALEVSSEYASDMEEAEESMELEPKDWMLAGVFADGQSMMKKQVVMLFIIQDMQRRSEEEKLLREEEEAKLQETKTPRESVAEGVAEKGVKGEITTEAAKKIAEEEAKKVHTDSIIDNIISADRSLAQALVVSEGYHLARGTGKSTEYESRGSKGAGMGARAPLVGETGVGQEAIETAKKLDVALLEAVEKCGGIPQNISREDSNKIASLIKELEANGVDIKASYQMKLAGGLRERMDSDVAEAVDKYLAANKEASISNIVKTDKEGRIFVERSSITFRNLSSYARRELMDKILLA